MSCPFITCITVSLVLSFTDVNGIRAAHHFSFLFSVACFFIVFLRLVPNITRVSLDCPFLIAFSLYQHTLVVLIIFSIYENILLIFHNPYLFIQSSNLRVLYSSTNIS